MKKNFPRILAKLALFSAIALGNLCSVFALPTIKEYIKTESGQYVYYRDYRIEKELYVGILYFDENTIEMRYLLSDENKNAKKSLSLYFTLAEKNGRLELTGERLPENATNDDVEIINYLHTFLYEISALRTRLNGIDKKDNFVEIADLQYFGGLVNVTCNNKIPVFGLESIESFDAEPFLKIVTIGSIADNTDKTFENFLGLDENGFNLLSKKTKQKKLNSKQLNSFVWTTSENLANAKTLGNDAFMFQLSLEIPENEFQNLGISAFEYFSRMNLLSQNGSYVNYPTAKIIEKENVLISEAQIYCPDEKNPFRHCIKILEKSDSSEQGKISYTLSVITVYEKFYLENKQYFDSLYQSTLYGK